MKTASTAMKAHLNQSPTTLAWLWKVKRTDGRILGFTSHDADIAYDNGDGDGSVTYAAKTGFLSTANQNKSDLSVDNLEVTGFLDSTAIDERDLRGNLYDDADIKLMFVNWNDLTMGHVVVRRGTLGIVKMQNGKFVAELRGLSYRLTSVLGASYGPLCRAEFGSGLNGIDLNSRYLCMIDVTLYRQSNTVTAAPGPTALVLRPETNLLMVGTSTPTASAPDGWFNDGIITFTSGANAGLSYEIKTYLGGYITLFLPALFTIAATDAFTIEPGCDKTAGACTNKYNNIVNFRGEPFIPGMDRYLDFPGVGSGIG